MAAARLSTDSELRGTTIRSRKRERSVRPIQALPDTKNPAAKLDSIVKINHAQT